MATRTITKVTADQAGCWLEGSRGWYASSALVRIAESLGMPLDDDDNALLDAYNSGDTGDITLSTGEVTDPFECVAGQGGMADMAETWLNDNVAPDGYYFGWHDGEFFLWSFAQWDEDSY